MKDIEEIARNYEGWHKTHGKQPQQIACPQGIVFFLIVRGSDQEKANKKNPLRSSRLGGSINSKFKTKNYQLVSIRGGSKPSYARMSRTI
jgi:hypothetical protein